MNARLIYSAAMMPAGTYWVGDPCYSVPDSRWMEWLQAADYENADRFLLAELDGKPVLGIGTAYGDGVYPGSDGNEYMVDAGLIGLVPAELADREPGNDAFLVTFERDFQCSYDEDEGTIHLGHISIKTDERDSDFDQGW